MTCTRLTFMTLWAFFKQTPPFIHFHSLCAAIWSLIHFKSHPKPINLEWKCLLKPSHMATRAVAEAPVLCSWMSFFVKALTFIAPLITHPFVAPTVPVKRHIRADTETKLKTVQRRNKVQAGMELWLTVV